MDFEEFTKNVSEEIIESKKRFTVIDGQMCSGKTTLGQNTAELLRNSGKDITLLEIDSFLLPRDQRHPKEHEHILDPEKWYHLEKLKAVLSLVTQIQKRINFCFWGYDRYDKGRVSKQISVNHDPSQSILIVEGLFAVKFMKILEADPDLSILLWTNNEKSLERRIERNSDNSKEKNTEKMRRVYFPAIEEYKIFLNEINFDCKVNTDDFDNLENL